MQGRVGFVRGERWERAQGWQWEIGGAAEKRDLDVQWEMLGTQVCSQNTSH